MRSRARARRGEIGSPIVSLILAVAGIAIAIIVIGYMMGAVGGMKKPVIESDSAFVYIKNGTCTLEFNIDNPSSKTVTIDSVRIKDDTDNLVTASNIDPTTIPGKEKVKVVVTFDSAQCGAKDTYDFIVDTSAGTVRGTASMT